MSGLSLVEASAGRRAVRIWFAVFGGIGTWLAHLVFEASFARHGCNSRGSTVWMHVATVGLAGLTVVAMALSLALVRGNPAGDGVATDGQADDRADPASQLHFLGMAGLLIGAINLALILFEGFYVLVLPRCG
jgi:quinol-cytochrome oxidoreductase complex cytochrome b subunit